MSSEVRPTPQQYGQPPMPPHYGQQPLVPSQHGQRPPMHPQYGMHPQPYMPMTAPTSGTAVAALVLSILWLAGLGSVIALLMVASSWTETRSGRRGGHGLNVVALILGTLGAIPVAFMIIVTMLGVVFG